MAETDGNGWKRMSHCCFIGETRVDGGDGAFLGYLLSDVSRETVVTMGWIARHNSRHSLKPTVMSPWPACSRISL